MGIVGICKPDDKGETCPAFSHFYLGQDLERTSKMGKKQDWAQVKARFIERWGDRYIYDHINESNYINITTKVPVECKEHGVFFITPDNHLHGKGCYKCAKNSQLTTEEFINRAKKVHGDKYDYSKVVYINAKTKVCIRCKDCDLDFMQSPSNHLNGRGCPHCRNIRISQTQKSNTTEFIIKAKKVHGNRYIYDKVNYINNSKKILIGCKKHGVYFEQSPCSHLLGSGCPYCANERKGAYKTGNRENFIKKAIAVHGDKYGYEEVIYTNARTKVKILCKKHNKFFWQEPYVHIKGCGCPYCRTSKGEELIEIFLQEYGITHQRQYKIRHLQKNLFCTNNNFFVDFYLPNEQVIIEFNGEQHYKEIKGWGGKDAFEKQQQRDIELKKICKDNKIRLIEISYLEINNIANILCKQLKIKNGQRIV